MLDGPWSWGWKFCGRFGLWGKMYVHITSCMIYILATNSKFPSIADIGHCRRSKFLWLEVSGSTRDISTYNVISKFRGVGFNDPPTFSPSEHNTHGSVCSNLRPLGMDESWCSSECLMSLGKNSSLNLHHSGTHLTISASKLKKKK